MKEGGTTVTNVNKKVPTEQEIAARAYELYLKRGGENGSALDDWLAAEEELTESIQMASHEPDHSNMAPSRKRAAAS